MAASFACALGARGTASLGTWGRPVRGSALAKPGAKRAASRAGGRRWCRKAPNGTPSRGRGKRPMPPWAPQGGEEPEAAAPLAALGVARAPPTAERPQHLGWDTGADQPSGQEPRAAAQDTPHLRRIGAATLAPDGQQT
jgi:hypothetical protein